MYVNNSKNANPIANPSQDINQNEKTVIQTDITSNQSDIVKSKSRYLDYTPQLFVESVDKKRVYFFHASWCPTCKTANEEFINNPDSIPNDVVVFKTDYDTEKELKQKYGITYQHTFVFVDAHGQEIKKWNGGGITELIANTKDK